MNKLYKSTLLLLGLTLLAGCGGANITENDIKPHKIDRVVLEHIDKENTFATLSINNDNTNYRFSFVADSNSAIKAHHLIFIDLDRSGERGYVLYDREVFAAEYLLEDGHLFRYTGVGGSDWSWAYVKEFKDHGEIKTYNLPLNTFGFTDKFNVQAVVLDENWDARRSTNVEVVTRTIDTRSHLTVLEIENGFSIAEDPLNFYFTLDSKYKHHGFFIDSDGDGQTGYSNGYDYLVEDKVLYVYTGVNGSENWSWTKIDDISVFQSDSDKTSIVPKHLVGNLNKTFTISAMGYDQDWQEETATASYAYIYR